MSSISEALKRAQVERERLRAGGGSAGADGKKRAAKPAVEEAGLAAVVLKKAGALEGDERGGVPAVSTGGEATARPVTTLTEAMRQSGGRAAATRVGGGLPVALGAGASAEVIVEDFAAKRKLNLPRRIVAYHDRASAAAEQYRKIRDGLMAGNPKRDPQALVFTSARGGEGKTTTVLNLGLSLVELRANRVLLVDGCLHESRRDGRGLSQMLKLPAARGLAELLASPAAGPGAERDSQPFIQATPWHHLYVLPAGAPTTSAAAIEMLSASGGTVLRGILRQLRASFSWILIDAPAITSLPDAGLLGVAADGMILTAAMHHTPAARLQAATRKLRSLNLPVKGVVLTRA